MATPRSFQLPESHTHYPRQKDVHVEHLRIALTLDFENKRISGTCDIRFSPLRTGVRKVVLDACGMEIASVTLDGAGVEFQYDNRKLEVPMEMETGRSHTIVVSYASEPREGVYFVGPDEEHPEKEVQAWTHNETEFARYWFPCQDVPDDKGSSELLVTVPRGFRVISNGKLVSTKEEGGKVTFYWKEDVPHSTYLTSFVAAKLGEISQESEGVPLHYNFPESKRVDALRYFGETPRMISVFNEVTGVKYPYEKYDQTAVEDFIFGGMENISATTLAMNYFPEASSEEDFQASYATPQTNAVNLVAHELAHMWFGDLVTCSDWAHAWLNEGFATYLQGLYLERTRGVDEFRWDMGLRAEQYLDEDKSEYRRPIVENSYITPDDVFDYTTYEKGEWMIHELRFTMGDASFFAGVKEFLTRHALGNADTHDLRKAMEKVSGYSLQEFFEQAFMKPGFPEFDVEYLWDEETKTATLTLKQTQDTGHGTPLFKLPCDIVFYTGNRRQAKRVRLDKAEQSFSFQMDRRPDIVEFDPQHWLLKKVTFNKPTDLLLNQLAGSSDATSRADAAAALGGLRSNLGVAGLRDAALREQFWDVRASALKALGEIGTPQALEALLACGIPANRRVRRGLAAALGNFKDEKARVILKDLLQKDASPYVRCEAALSIAKSWPEGALPVLKEAMKPHTTNESLAEACLDAMGGLKNEEIQALIMENLRYGKPVRMRIGALKAIKRRARFLEEEIPIIKEILLRDKDFRVRQYVASTLVREIGDRRLLDALKEAADKDKDPRVRRKSLEAYYEISAGAEFSSAVANLREEVKKLKEQNRLFASQGTPPQK